MYLRESENPTYLSIVTINKTTYLILFQILFFLQDTFYLIPLPTRWVRVWAFLSQGLNSSASAVTLQGCFRATLIPSLNR